MTIDSISEESTTKNLVIDAEKAWKKPNIATEEPINVYLDKIMVTVLTPFPFETSSRF